MTKLISSPSEWKKEIGNLQYVINNVPFNSKINSCEADVRCRSALTMHYSRDSRNHSKT